MDFTYIEKKAMTCALMVLALKSGKIDDNIIEIVKDSLQVDDEILVVSSKINLLEALNIIKLMPIMKKMRFAMIALKINNANGAIHAAATLATKQYFDFLGVTEFLDVYAKHQETLKSFGKIDWNK